MTTKKEKIGLNLQFLKIFGLKGKK